MNATPCLTLYLASIESSFNNHRATLQQVRDALAEAAYQPWDRLSNDGQSLEDALLIVLDAAAKKIGELRHSGATVSGHDTWLPAVAGAVQRALKQSILETWKISQVWTSGKKQAPDFKKGEQFRCIVGKYQGGESYDFTGFVVSKPEKTKTSDALYQIDNQGKEHATSEELAGAGVPLPNLADQGQPALDIEGIVRERLTPVLERESAAAAVAADQIADLAELIGELTAMHCDQFNRAETLERELIALKATLSASQRRAKTRA